MRKHPCQRRLLMRGNAGLSLVELLTVICILGLLAAIALPYIGNLAGGEPKEIRNRRNAQEIASVCVVADSAGLKFVVDGDVKASIRNVMAGGTPTDGPFKGRRFAVKGLAETDVDDVEKYLTVSNGLLSYSTTAKR